ncbi:hypothetical protein JOE61_003550 [Nocardioides salarius]|uniref:Uncharacterized protein n=1 Tax=Nocardioides salarius TaxID=374513 RepID=A0ABS2MEY3_9ACTN|nr:hypothetical protein [Nocardioides salarius]MBM7509736.1 hypothetical protein [Nocardioides salarius]
MHVAPDRQRDDAAGPRRAGGVAVGPVLGRAASLRRLARGGALAVVGGRPVVVPLRGDSQHGDDERAHHSQDDDATSL